eukprot:g2428.t1
MVLVLLLSAHLAASADYQWEVVQLGNVYGKDYKSDAVYEVNAATATSCQAACAANATCTSYDWTTNSTAGKQCTFLNQCWLRTDGVWHPKQQAKCNKQAGRKIAPTPAPTPIPPAPKGARNVLFVIFDDLRIIHDTWDMGPQPHTPNTDALGARGLAFDRAYCNQAVCGPSRASLLSGRRPDTTQMWNFNGGFRQTPGAEAWNTWPEYFRKHGYYTYGVGKLFHPGDPQDFDPQSWSSGAYGGYFGQDNCPLKKNPSHGCAVDPAVYPNHSFPDLETLALAKSALTNATADPTGKPFWIGVGFVKPHMPHVFPASFYDDVPALADIEIAANTYPPNGTARLEWESGAEGPGKWDSETAPDTARDWRRGYYAAAAFSDHLLGQLLAALNDTGAAENTIVVLTADHGWGLGEHNHWIKYTNWETDARVPLIIADPSAPQTHGKHTGSLVEHVDLYPTLAEMAGLGVVDKKTESIEGDSYAVLFDKERTPDPEAPAAFWANAANASFTQYPRCCTVAFDPQLPLGEQCQNGSAVHRCTSTPKDKFTFMGYSMRTTEFRYTEYARWGGVNKPLWFPVPHALCELYDHRANKGRTKATFEDFENVNLANDIRYQETVQTLSRRLRAFFDRGNSTSTSN